MKSTNAYIQFKHWIIIKIQIWICVLGCLHIYYWNTDVDDVNERIRFVADIIDPIDKKIEEYRTKLYKTVEKFEFNF